MSEAIPPGDDAVPVPPPVDEEPPHDRFCDLVLTGGVASGVVYPWAIVELARSYRFRNIGGTSVGAMAAALAAAAEYGRRTGAKAPFEPLRRTPAALGKKVGGRTRMLSLFQAKPCGRRLIALWGVLGRGSSERAAAAPRRGLAVDLAFAVVRLYRRPLLLGALGGLLLSAAGHAAIFLALLIAVAGAIVGLAWAVWCDIRDGIVANRFGLCPGGTLEPAGPEGKRPGLSEWLHEGIQASAGLDAKDRPLTFRDLWTAPMVPGAARQPCGDDDPATHRAINLVVITTNVTHGRPYRLPLPDAASRLFFKRADLEDYFPAVVLDAMVAAARPYAPRSASDPERSKVENWEDFLELPGADLPVVVAARLSLSFPLLFCAVPLWAIDYEAPRGKRDLKQCLFTDGGVSSNFPIHLFDAALPRSPTFGLWLDERSPYAPQPGGPEDDVWLPEFHGQGWGDSWQRFHPAAAANVDGASAQPKSTDKPPAKQLSGFLLALVMSAKDWRDRTSFQLPHVRNRVARLRLRPGEGGLHIGMPREQILDMAHRYGTRAGKLFVRRYADRDGLPSRAWSEQRWVRLMLLVNGLRERLTGLAASEEGSARTMPMARSIARATQAAPIMDRQGQPRLSAAQAGSLEALLVELERMEQVLRAAERQDFVPKPEPELRLRAPL